MKQLLFLAFMLCMKTVLFSSLCIPGCPTSLPVSSDRPRPRMYLLTYKCRSTFAVIWSKYYKDCAFIIFITVFFFFVCVTSRGHFRVVYMTPEFCSGNMHLLEQLNKSVGMKTQAIWEACFFFSSGDVDPKEAVTCKSHFRREPVIFFQRGTMRRDRLPALFAIASSFVFFVFDILVAGAAETREM